MAWAGLVGEAVQHAYFATPSAGAAFDGSGDPWVAALQTRAITYVLSLITTGLLVYTTVHVYGMRERFRQAKPPSSCPG